MQSRWKSPVAWGSVIMLICLVCQSFGLYSYLGIEEDELTSILEGIISVLVVFGIFNNPTNKEEF